jgi:hypothetical protein
MSHGKTGAKQFIPSSPLSTIIPENYHSEPIDLLRTMCTMLHFIDEMV